MALDTRYRVAIKTRNPRQPVDAVVAAAAASILATVFGCGGNMDEDMCSYVSVPAKRAKTDAHAVTAGHTPGGRRVFRTEICKHGNDRFAGRNRRLFARFANGSHVRTVRASH